MEQIMYKTLIFCNVKNYFSITRTPSTDMTVEQ